MLSGKGDYTALARRAIFDDAKKPQDLQGSTKAVADCCSAVHRASLPT
jgi:hypothetical protein